MAKQMSTVVAAAAVAGRMMPRDAQDLDWLVRHLLDETAGDARKVADAVSAYEEGEWPERAAMALGTLAERWSESLEAQLDALAELEVEGAALALAALREVLHRDDDRAFDPETDVREWLERTAAEGEPVGRAFAVLGAIEREVVPGLPVRGVLRAVSMGYRLDLTGSPYGAGPHSVTVPDLGAGSRERLVAHFVGYELAAGR